MNLFSNNLDKYFLTKDTFINTKKSVSIVLSPEFYWIRVFEIPVENSRKATKLLPTLFEEILPEYEKFDYYCIQKSENLFLSFAFNAKEILSFVKKSGLKTHQIQSVYFAQTQMLDYDSFIIEDSGYVYDKDILIKVPKSFCEDAFQLTQKIENDIVDQPIDLNYYSTMIPHKYVYTFCALVLIVSLLNFFKYTFYMSEIDENRTTIEKLKSEHKLPKTSFQMNAIIKNMRVEKEIHKQFKESLFYILNYKKILNEGTISKINYNDGKFIVVFKNINNNRIKRYLQSKLRILSSSSTKEYIKIEVSL